MSDIVARFAEDFATRLAGPLRLRFLLQPAVAVVFAALDGRRDAQHGKTPYGWALFTDPEHRRDLLQTAWKSIGKVFLAAIVVDAIYQALELHVVYPGEALLVGVLLAIIPYVLLRGVVTRIAARRDQSGACRASKPRAG